MEKDISSSGTRKRTRAGESAVVERELSASPRRTTLSSSDGLGPPAPKRVACIQCRQSKLRCDSPKDPCSRCHRLGLPCTKDRGYKRINKRSKIDDLEKQVQELKGVLDRGLPDTTQPLQNIAKINTLTSPSLGPWTGFPVTQAPNFPSPAQTDNGSTRAYTQSSSNSVLRGHETLLQPADNHFTVTPRTHRVLTTRAPALKVRAIESTALGTIEIDALFSLYFDHFHHFFPVLNPLRSPDQYYERSQLLFWTIIGVASRRYVADPGLQPTLAKSVLDLAWKVISDPPLVCASVQAILVLCIWPPSSTHLWSDVSATLSHVAMIGAMHMGLHRPTHIKEFTRNPKTGGAATITEGDKIERNKTWAACNIVSQWTVANIGYPPTGACWDWSIERACEAGNPYSVPEDLRYQLIIQKFCYRTTKSMSDNVSDPLGLPSDEQHDVIMKMKELELTTIEGQLGENLSVSDKLYLRGARLHLETFYWLGRLWTEQKRLGALKSYATASVLINEFAAADDSFEVLTYGPIVYPRMLFNAAYIILKVLNSSLSQWVDVEAGATSFHSATACLRRFSCQENDITFRAVTILTDVWQHRDEIYQNEKNIEPGLVSRSRLGASMTFDCLWRWKDKFPDQRVSNGPYKSSHPSYISGDSETVGPSSADFDPVTSSFDWALFDDFNWPWNFDTNLPVEA